MNIYNATRTVYNVKLQTCMMANIPYLPLPNTTLNEKFNILENVQRSYVPDNITFPHIQGLVIGNGGKELVKSSIGDLCLGRHTPIDGALFNHLPFVLRPIDNDLPDTDKLNYRLRKELYIDGNQYVAYYLKKFNNDLEYRPEILYVDNSASIPSVKILDTDREDILNPSPNLDNQIANYENSVQTINMLKFVFKLSDFELLELKNVFSILNIQDTILTELGVVTGIDIDNGNNKELIYAQIAFFLYISLDLELIDNVLEKNIEIGGGELIPLIRDVNG